MKFMILFAFALAFIMAVVAEPAGGNRPRPPRPARPNPPPFRPVKPHQRIRREYPVRGDDVTEYPEYDVFEALPY